MKNKNKIHFQGTTQFVLFYCYYHGHIIVVLLMDLKSPLKAQVFYDSVS